VSAPPSTEGVLYLSSRSEWRSWLESHHESAGEARVAIYNRDLRSSRLLKRDVSPPECDGHAQDKNARSVNSSAIHATEDAVLCRAVRSGGRDLASKQPSKDPRAELPTLADVQEEALCFGWIDTTGHKLDESAYMIRLVPRRPNSEWSMTNVVRVERLAAQGLMTEAGWRAVDEAKRNGQWDLAMRVEQTDLVPPPLEAALCSVPGALDAYLSLPHSRRKLMLRSVLSAKTAATLDRRIAAIVGEVSAP
jgi:uncharacterized protein YdeI (YjbR/CyaY-like superfamily)